MKKKYQLDNPNNCRVSIDFNNSKSPVKFEYVGEQSPFSICYNLFFYKLWVYMGMSLIFVSGMFLGFYKSTLYPSFFFWSVGMIASIWIIPIFFAFLFSKTKLIKLVPYIWASGKTKYYVQFEPKDLKDNKVEIPLFKNQFLSYKLTEDFIDKIDKIDIVEHPFSELVLKGNGRKQLNPNEHLWKAVFTFKEEPKSGLLMIIFA